MLVMLHFIPSGTYLCVNPDIYLWIILRPFHMPPISEDTSIVGQNNRRTIDTTISESIVGDQINDMLDEALDISPQVIN